MIPAGFAVGSVYLNRRVIDSEPLADPVNHPDGVWIRRRAVEGERDLAVADAPDMEILIESHPRKGKENTAEQSNATKNT